MKRESQSKMFVIVAALMVVLAILLGVLTVQVLQLKKYADLGSTKKTTYFL